MKHTPRPTNKDWIINITRTSYACHDITVEAKSLDEAKEKALDRAGDHVFSEHNADYDISDDLDATAALIAAAPELLAALEALVAQHDRPHGFPDEHWYRGALNPARAAIAKARGSNV